MEIWQLAVCIVGGFMAGVINTFAGNGSAITLSILTEVLGLPSNVANGSNRIGALFQSSASSLVFLKYKTLKLREVWDIAAFTFIGAIVGVITATQVSNDQFDQVFRFLMAAMLIVILVNPKRWISPKQSESRRKLPVYLSAPLFLVLGFYGGFIQMGMGIFFLAATVLIVRYDIIVANGIKVFVIALYTTVVLAIFHFQGLVDWKYGAIIAIGQTLGGILAAQYATTYENAGVYAYRILVIIVCLVVLRQFGVFDLITNL